MQKSAKSGLFLLYKVSQSSLYNILRCLQDWNVNSNKVKVILTYLGCITFIIMFIISYSMHILCKNLPKAAFFCSMRFPYSHHRTFDYVSDIKTWVTQNKTYSNFLGMHHIYNHAYYHANLCMNYAKICQKRPFSALWGFLVLVIEHLKMFPGY